jgi:hypothetical protein
MLTERGTLTERSAAFKVRENSSPVPRADVPLPLAQKALAEKGNDADAAVLLLLKRQRQEAEAATD